MATRIRRLEATKINLRQTSQRSQPFRPMKTAYPVRIALRQKTRQKFVARPATVLAQVNKANEDYALLGWETQLALGITYTIAGVNMVKPTTKVHHLQPIRRVKAAEDVIIPARSEVIVPGIIEGEGTPKTTLISSSPEMEKARVAVGKVLVSATRGDCSVRFLNPSEESPIVKKGDIIAGVDLNPVVSALKEGQLPTAKLQAGFSAKTKRCFAEWERLELRGVVY